MNEIEKFQLECKNNVQLQSKNQNLKNSANDFLQESIKSKYSYNFKWLGCPIIQYPQDIIAMQELIWHVKPDLIIETGVAHGGSIIFYASLLELIGNDGVVLGIDIDIRKHNKDFIETHPMYKRIKLIEGSSISDEIITKVRKFSLAKKKIMICLDSNHTHEHVFNELLLYAPLTSVDSYCVVFDTIVEDLPMEWDNRNWGKGNNPKTAVHEFLKINNDFIIDHEIDNKLLISVAPHGFLKRIK